MKLAYINGIDNLTLTASSEASGFDVENVQQEHLSKRWRATGDTSEDVVIAATALNPDVAFLAGHNLSDSAVVKIQGNDTDSWGAPAVDITMSKSDGVYYALTGFSSRDFWRFLITDPTNPDGFIEVGRMWAGAAVFVRGPSISFSDDLIDTSVTDISLSGQPYGDKRYSFRALQTTYPLWTDTEKAAMELYSKTVKKSVPHFVIYNDAVIATLGPVYVILTSDVSFNHIKKVVKWTSSLNHREVF